MKTLVSLSLYAVMITATCVTVAHAGRVGLAVKGGRAALKVGAKEVVEHVSVKIARQAEEKIAARYGVSAVEKAGQFTTKRGIPREKVLRLLTEHGDVLARHGFSEEAMHFALTHKGPGIFFLRHPELFDALKKSLEIEKLDSKVVSQAWRWGDDKAIGGSLGRLREALTRAGMNNGKERDFCEHLFAVKAQTGKIPGMQKGTKLVSGHLGDARQGIDFLHAESGKIRVIEFGTGRKPIAGEMSWDRIRSNLADFLERQDTSARINLRGRGFPSEIVTNPAKLRDPAFPIEKFVQRELYAPEVDAAQLAKVGSDVIARQLH
jgi:hypothetical protein